MKKTILIIVSVFVLVLIIGIIVAVIASMKKPPVTANPGNSFPVSSTTASGTTGTSGQGTMTIAGQDGRTLTVKDFIHNGETVADVVNEGRYFLAGSIGYCLVDGTCPSGAKSDQYIITYNAKDQSFIVAITAEPLGASRLAAEKFLVSRLGLDQQHLCDLKYSVLVSNQVNEQYSGIANLGFSSCSGATRLP